MNSVWIAGLVVALNDGSGALGVGGTVMPMGPHKQVAMQSELVRVSLPLGAVETRFVFQNTGPSSDVVMVFPENGSIGEANFGKVKSTYFKYFRSWVDGEPTKVSRLMQRKEVQGGLWYEYWWTKRVPFAKGQKRVVVNKYQGGLGWGSIGEPPTETFAYILQTGARGRGR